GSIHMFLSTPVEGTWYGLQFPALGGQGHPIWGPEQFHSPFFQFFRTLVETSKSMGTKVGNVFVQGGIAPEFIADSIAKHSSKLQIGAHQIFLGQVRADAIDGKTVTAIEYTAYESMANQKFQEIKEAAFSKFDLVCMHCHHSLGRVEAGEVCLFVFVSSPHRK